MSGGIEGVAAMDGRMPASIAKALVKAQLAVNPVNKDGENLHQKYRYATMDSLAEECRRAMTSAGLALVIVGAVVVKLDGKDRLRPTAVLCHESGDTWLLPDYSIPIVVAGKTGIDKAEAAALTYARGYLSTALLQIAREDEHAVDRRADEGREPVDHQPVLAALDAATDARTLRLAIERASEMRDLFTDEQDAAVGAAVERAKARLETNGAPVQLSACKTDEQRRLWAINQRATIAKAPPQKADAVLAAVLKACEGRVSGGAVRAWLGLPTTPDESGETVPPQY